MTTRLDLFAFIHKALRFALADLLCRMGATDFTDAAALKVIAGDLRLVTSLCEDHLRTEEAIILPALRGRLTGTLDTIAAAHEDQTRLVAELRATADALLEADVAARPRVGCTLYLHFSTFTAENLAHMSEEELLISPLFERLFTDDEVRALHGRVMAMLTLEEHARGARYLLRAVNPAERVALVTGVVATMSREAVVALLDIARPTMKDAELADLLNRTGLAS